MAELTNNLRKKYASLASSKGRKEEGLFMAQGDKCVADTIDYFQIETIIASPAWIASHKSICSLFTPVQAKPADLQKISTLSNPPEVIAVYRIPEDERPQLSGRLSLALDCVQDPGNLGTIIRVADWMGVDTILASHDTVDVWNPKVVQATMGAISRVRVHYCDLKKVLAKVNVPVYGTFLNGDDIYSASLSDTGIILMGNEGKGISDELKQLVTRKITIPPYPKNRVTSESLNVAVATSVILAEFRRRCF